MSGSARAMSATHRLDARIASAAIRVASAAASAGAVPGASRLMASSRARAVSKRCTTIAWSNPA